MEKKNDDTLAAIQMTALLLNIPTFEKLDNPRDVLLIIENELEDLYLNEQILVTEKKEDGTLVSDEFDINKKNLIRARELLHRSALSRIEQFDALLEFITLSSSFNSLSDFHIEGADNPSPANIFSVVSNLLLMDIASPFPGHSVDFKEISERTKMDGENRVMPREPETGNKKYTSTCMSLAVSALLHANKNRDVRKGENNLNVSAYSKKLVDVCEKLTGGDAIPTQQHEAIAGRLEDGMKELKTELPLNKSIKDYLSEVKDR